MNAAANRRGRASGGSKGSSLPDSNLRCGWCRKPIRKTTPPSGNVEQGGFDGIPTLSTKPGPMPGAVLDRGKWFRWWHHECHNMAMALKASQPPDLPDCDRPGCMKAVAQEGAFCTEHWAELPEPFFDPIVFAMDEQDREGWKAAVKSAIAWYQHRDGGKP